MSFYKDVLNSQPNNHKNNDGEVELIQGCLIKMLNEINPVFKKYGIKPVLIEGNALGKVRHNGFIPWDDDLDIALIRSDYKKFEAIFEDELSDRYVISSPVGKHKASNRFIQIGRKGTKIKGLYQEKEDLNSPTQHIYIDIFPIDYVPDNVIIRVVKGIWVNFIMACAGCVSYCKNRNAKVDAILKSSFRGKVELFCRIFLGTILSFWSETKWMHIVDKSVEGKKETNHLGITVARNHYFGEIMEKNVYFPLRETDYCGVNVYRPNKIKEYLRKVYGDDYMMLPPEEKRESHHAMYVKIDEGIF
ncbi:MAG: LicD family protein [Lachnospiraceae bacterium]|nr:LicD family protein [Lachnospiraceae bacterium]